MRYTTSLLLLASSALASQLQPRGGGEDDYGHGGETAYVTEVDYTTYTTVCPVTETKTEGGKETTITYTTTSTVVEAIHTTVYDHVTLPGATKTDTEVDYTTYTTVCPVTVTKTVEGEETTVVYTTTSTVVEAVKSTDYEHVTIPGATKTDVEVDYTTYTTVCPVTVTKTVEGEETTVTYTTTSTVVEAVKSTDYEHVTIPGATKTDVEVDYTTYTTVCPVTVTKTIEGEESTVVYTTTSIVTEAVKSTDYEHVTIPGATKTDVEVDYSTYTTVCPVTVTKTIEGKETTLVYTTTSVVKEAIQTTIYDHVKQPDVTKYQTEIAYVTQTSLCPVTETKTISGEVVTLIHTSTQYIVKTYKTTLHAYKTIYHTADEYKVHTEYSKVYITVGGGTVVETIVPKTTVQIPQTEVVTKSVQTITTPGAASSTPAPSVVTGAAVANSPVFALMAGVIGAIVLL